MALRNVLGLFSKQPLVINGEPALHWVFWTSIRNSTGINVSLPLNLQLQLLLQGGNALQFDRVAIAAAENLPVQGQMQFPYGPVQVDTLLLNPHTIATVIPVLPDPNKTLVIINSGHYTGPSSGFLSYICPKGHVLTDSDIANALGSIKPPPQSGPWILHYSCTNCGSGTYTQQLV